MDAITSLLSAFGLSTAAGLNAYIPLLVVGLLGRYTDLIQLSGPYEILKHPAVLLVIAVLALLDFIADKVPAVDHALHMVGLIISPLAGAILFLAANGPDGMINPWLAAFCGIVLAGLTHGARATARPIATATTGGVGNPILSFVEDSTALVLSVLSVLLPVLAFVLVVLFALLMVLLMRRVWVRRQGRTP